MKSFSSYKLICSPTIEEINNKTDLRVEYGQRMRGRKITGFQFSVRHKVQPQALPAPAQKMSLNEYVKIHGHPGESWDQARERLAVSYRRYLEK